jgi:hypothetical protein
MRLKRERIVKLARNLGEGLLKKGLVALDVPVEQVVQRIDRVLHEELQVEDRLNEEVREILKSYDEQIRNGSVDYQKMFQMIKSKLVKDRGIVL